MALEGSLTLPAPGRPRPALIDAARPRARSGHVVRQEDGGGQLLVTSGSRLYGLDAAQAGALRDAELSGEAELAVALSALGIEEVPPPEVRADTVRALALTVAQTCNLACTYCYAAGGDFGGPSRRMPWPVAEAAIDRIVAEAPPGGAVSIAFIGGEPLVARDLIRRATNHARRRAAARAVKVAFSMTTNGTLVEPEDADFFARHRFTLTVSLDGGAAVHDALRPTRSGRGSFARVAQRLAPLLHRADRIELSARVTVTPRNLDVSAGVEELGALGFQSVGVSPLLSSPNGRGTLAASDFATLLSAMTRCGDRWVEDRLAGRCHPFANLETALKELAAGKPRAVSCGAAAAYLAVDAEGDYAACHRFVRAPEGALGSLVNGGVDDVARDAWVRSRHVDTQEPCSECWARYLCGGGCHHEVLSRGRPACDYVRGWLHYAIGVYGRLAVECPELLGRR